MLISAAKFPYTGPLYGPSHKTEPPSKNRATVMGLKRAMIRLGYLAQPLGSETDDFGAELESAMKVWFRKEYAHAWTFYGTSSWNALRGSLLKDGPHKGEPAMDAKALAYVKSDALKICYPHPLGVSGVFVGQGPHQTDGLPWVNIAVDFMAPGGTKVLAVVNATITRLSGHNPREGVIDPPGVFGWTIYYDTADGYHYFSTHFGKTKVVAGQRVDCGQVIAEVGDWPRDPGRSHTHLGVSSPKGRADATKRILEISQAPRVAA